MNHSVGDWLTSAARTLEAAHIASARLDALILLEDATSKDRSWLLAHPEFSLNSEQLAVLEAQLERRATHEPLAYIREKSEFYGREFKVTPATLQPRPETETIISLLKSLKLPKQVKLADIGTGSGAIAITTKLELPEAIVFATEIQPEALIVAKENAERLRAKVQFHLGNLLEPLKDEVIEVILANLPYVPDGHQINKAAMQEPRVAIFGGSDGLDLYRQLFDQIDAQERKPSYILTESLPFQHATLSSIASQHGYSQTNVEDFIQFFVYDR